MGGADGPAAPALPRRLFHYNAGFLRDARLRRILTLAGHEPCLGWPSAGDGVAVWGRSPYARRGEWVAARAGVPLVRIEDAFLRSVKPARLGGERLGIVLDDLGVHFDAAQPSRLERLIAGGLDDPNLIRRASEGMARLRASDLSKYNIHRSGSLSGPAFVLLVDQVAGDASLRYSGAAEDVFSTMLAAARSEHPTRRIVVKAHPETIAGLRRGASSGTGVEVLTEPISPHALIDAAEAIYTVSSQMGFEAILAGRRPVVFGRPFYAGWGLSDDRLPSPPRGSATAEQLFAAAMLLAPIWYDPCRDRLCSFEEALDQLEAEVRAWREDAAGHVALGMRLWKRGRIQAVFGREKPVRFAATPALAVAEAERRRAGVLVWAGREPEEGFAAPGTLRRVEDGFLRSRGLGADLVPPLSLVADDLGIYFDPTRPSRLETSIAGGLPPGGDARVKALIARLTEAGLTKYNIGTATLPDLPPGRRILVPGQVEDDASIRLGAGEVRTNLALVRAVRAANPDAILVYKPHPDVEAGLRPGRIAPADLARLVDATAERTDPAMLLGAVEEVWTMTSLLGFEALVRGKRVVCLGMPFYAGWGLTHDLIPAPTRRAAMAEAFPPTLAALVHAALIAYPRYYDPVSRLPCPPEVALHRLATGDVPRPSGANRILAKAQGWLAGRSSLWRQ